MRMSIVVILSLVAGGCAYDRNFINHRSVLRGFVNRTHAHDQIRGKLLELTPLGTARPKVEDVLVREGTPNKSEHRIPDPPLLRGVMVVQLSTFRRHCAPGQGFGVLYVRWIVRVAKD
jgi:hypothetical protein